MEAATSLPRFSDVFMSNGNLHVVEGDPTTVRTFLDATSEHLGQFCSLRSAETGQLVQVNPEFVSEIAPSTFSSPDDPAPVIDLRPAS